MKFFHKTGVSLFIDAPDLSLNDLENLLYHYCCQGFRNIITNCILLKFAQDSITNKLTTLYNLKLQNICAKSPLDHVCDWKNSNILIHLKIKGPLKLCIPNIHKIYTNYKSGFTAKSVVFRNGLFSIQITSHLYFQDISDHQQYLQLGVDTNIPLVKFLDINRLNKCILIDRDGVINHDFGYVSNYENFKYTDRVFDFLKSANMLNYRIFIITNQSGIGRGFYNEDDFWKLSSQMLNDFLTKDIFVDYIFYSPYYEHSTSPKYRLNSHYRKPNIGLFEVLLENWNVDLTNSIMIGDKLSDIQFAERAQLKSFLYPKYSFKDIFDSIND